MALATEGASPGAIRSAMLAEHRLDFDANHEQALARAGTGRESHAGGLSPLEVARKYEDNPFAACQESGPIGCIA